MVGVLMIMCEKRFLLQVIFERDTQGRREGHKQILLVVGGTSSKHHICCFTSRFLVEEHCNMGTKVGPCLKVEIGR